MAQPWSCEADAQRLEPLGVVLLDVVDPTGEVGERVAVGRQHDGDALERGDPVERVEVGPQRIALDEARRCGA